jgi:hypothetical protein
MAQMPGTTVVQELNQGEGPKSGCTSISALLFWFFFAGAKKNEQKDSDKLYSQSIHPESVSL